MSAQFMNSQESCHSEKKAYATPEVTVHGKVETITATSDDVLGSSLIDTPAVTDAD